MSNVEELMSNLRKAKANLTAAREQQIDAELKYESACDSHAEANKAYKEALSAIEKSAQ